MIYTKRIYNSTSVLKIIKNFFGPKRGLEEQLGKKIDLGIESALKPLAKEQIQKNIIYVWTRSMIVYQWHPRAMKSYFHMWMGWVLVNFMQDRKIYSVVIREF